MRDAIGEARDTIMAAMLAAGRTDCSVHVAVDSWAHRRYDGSIDTTREYVVYLSDTKDRYTARSLPGVVALVIAPESTDQPCYVADSEDAEVDALVAELEEQQAPR